MKSSKKSLDTVKDSDSKLPIKVKDEFVIQELEINGIKLLLKIDYRKKEISFVEREDGYGNQTNQYRGKRWTFSSRGREYLGGWIMILDAMKKATEYGDMLLKENEQREFNDFAKMLYSLGSKMSDEDN